MSPKKQRVQPCSQQDAVRLLRRAEAFLEVAELARDETDPNVEYRSVAAALAVLAGIAASDAACCKELNERSRSQDHRDATNLLSEIPPGGAAAASSLRRLIDLKDSAHYGLISVSSAELRRALRQAAELVEFAKMVLRR